MSTKSHPNPKFAKEHTGPIGDDRFRNDPEGPGRRRTEKEHREQPARTAQTYARNRPATEPGRRDAPHVFHPSAVITPTPQAGNNNGHELNHRIAEKAYELYKASGYADGHDVDHWLEAERMVLAELGLPESEFKVPGPPPEPNILRDSVFIP